MLIPSTSDYIEKESTVILDRIDVLLAAQRLLVSSFMEDPEPCWHKRVVYRHAEMAFVMDRVNHAYTRATGIEAEKYSGNPDALHWDAQDFDEVDRLVVTKRRGFWTEEFGLIAGEQDPQVWVGSKHPSIKGEDVVGVWGRARPWNPYDWLKVREYDVRYRNQPLPVQLAEWAKKHA